MSQHFISSTLIPNNAETQASLCPEVQLQRLQSPEINKAKWPANKVSREASAAVPEVASEDQEVASVAQEADSAAETEVAVDSAEVASEVEEAASEVAVEEVATESTNIIAASILYSLRIN